MHASDLFALPASLGHFSAFFRPDAAPWEWLRQIGPALASLQPGASPPPVAAGASPAVRIEGAVWVDPTVKLPAYCTLIGPAWIGPGTEIRPGAFIRGNVIAGAGCVLGNACEFKNCLLLDGVQVPHFNYVGDSILGNRAHLGAGVICSNLRLDQRPVTVRVPGGAGPGAEGEPVTVDTGLKKFGALLGDQAEAGCNAVLNPGSILGRRALVMPATPFTGYLPAATIARARGNLTFLPRRD
ncbi:hypothetical protein OpiT1DRAFT_04374 [Opitutaceae bacterium TAV1]|nr:hypothetical protein OpiT1DRAFT_04374 [Opitutaceae bacterium TAV1]